jgi:hypothetical protein
MYAQDADITRMPYTDTGEINPLFRGNAYQNPFGSPTYNSNRQFMRPGMARPIPPQSLGTPYGGTQTTGFDPNNYGNMGGSDRPPPFSTSVTDWTGRQMSPSQFQGQRDAFVQQINSAQGRQSALSGLGGGPPQPLDFQGMYGAASDAVQSGWQNPFAQQSMGFGGIRAYDDPSNPRGPGGGMQYVGGWPDGGGNFGRPPAPDYYGVSGSNRRLRTPPSPSIPEAPPPQQPAPAPAPAPAPRPTPAGPTNRAGNPLRTFASQAESFRPAPINPNTGKPFAAGDTINARNRAAANEFDGWQQQQQINSWNATTLANARAATQRKQALSNAGRKF